jgi:hypothetical protein
MALEEIEPLPSPAEGDIFFGQWSYRKNFRLFFCAFIPSIALTN